MYLDLQIQHIKKKTTLKTSCYYTLGQKNIFTALGTFKLDGQPIVPDLPFNIINILEVQQKIKAAAEETLEAIADIQRSREPRIKNRTLKPDPEFLHSHPGLEGILGVDAGHVIVDKVDWLLAKQEV